MGLGWKPAYVRGMPRFESAEHNGTQCMEGRPDALWWVAYDTGCALCLCATTRYYLRNTYREPVKMCLPNNALSIVRMYIWTCTKLPDAFWGLTIPIWSRIHVRILKYNVADGCVYICLYTCSIKWTGNRTDRMELYRQDDVEFQLRCTQGRRKIFWVNRGQCLVRCMCAASNIIINIRPPWSENFCLRIYLAWVYGQIYA